ncbi:MAG: prepilin-type N-terminal cleavage/methylation domain-containing protein [Phycisphaerales bacterium]|nr:prepilin-type N-terminal cleavage/methylation domain-containing protein [Phycisphaerales bacterium]
MRNTIRKGFTLVEILIVVVILGILAAIVIPQFTNASNEAVKGALESQLQTINSQVELYRVRNNGDYPALGTAATNNGWGNMVSAQYLKEEPVNGYFGRSNISVGDMSAAMAQTRDSNTSGWTWDEATSAVYAAGFDPRNKLLAHETGFGGSGGSGGTTP